MANKSIKGNSKYSEEMLSNIDNYSNEIETIKDFMEVVRMRPGMYIGPREAAGFLNMIREIFQNALDQLLSAKSPCDFIKIVYDMRHGGIVTISDNGLGIPFDDMIRIFTESHTSKNFKKELGDYSAGLNGVGAKATNALSSSFVVTSYKYTGEAKRVSFSKGKLLKEELLSNKEYIQGTEVVFTPDRSIMGDTHLESRFLYLLIRDMLSLTPIGSKVDYTSISETGKMYHEVMINEDGIFTNLISKCENMLIKPIFISNDNGSMKVDAAFTFDAKNIDGENITAFANMCPTSTEPKNTHVSGFLDGITSWFVKNVSVYLGEKSKVKVVNNDVKAGLSAMISAFHLEPDFTGQAKEVFSNSDYKPFIKQVVMGGLDEWMKTNPQDYQKVCKFIKEVAEIRMKSENEKVKITAKYNTSATSGLPSKYKRPTGPSSLGWELIIVEGDSAESSARSGRCEKRQGIFPIRGKILNVYDATPERIADNAEIQSIIKIIGAGYGKTFDITKVKFKKIIILADADADGAHIASLLLLLFLKLFPGLVESGKVYKAVPPLYGIQKGKNKYEYFTERVDFAKYTQKQFYNTHKVQEADGRTITPSRFTDLLMENEDYTYTMEAVTNRYKIDPLLLEKLLIAHLCKYSFQKIRKMVVSSYRFLTDENITQSGNTIKIKGLVNSEVQTIFFNDRFIEDCKEIIYYVERALLDKRTEFLLDGKTVGLYELIKAAESGTSANVTRYKGLGEMDGPQLGESALHPDSNRMLVQYTADDIKKDIQIIRQHQSDKKMILANIGSVNRIDLLG